MELKNKISEEFNKRFNKPGSVYASAGRINLIGEHTDYNGGFVFPGAIDKVIMAKIAPNDTDKVRVYSVDLDDYAEFGPNASDAEELQARVNVGEKYNSDMFVSLHVNSSVNKNVGGFSTYYYPKTDNDLRLAKNIQNKLAANFGVDDLGVRQANFYVIKRISMPAVLVEMCFISNEKELTLMKGQWFQKKTARLIAEGIEKYFA